MKQKSMSQRLHRKATLLRKISEQATNLAFDTDGVGYDFVKNQTRLWTFDANWKDIVDKKAEDEFSRKRDARLARVEQWERKLLALIDEYKRV